MIPKNKLRMLEVKTPMGWVEADMGALERGDVVRWHEPDGTPVSNMGDGKMFEFTVAETPFVACDAVRKVSQRAGG